MSTNNQFVVQFEQIVQRCGVGALACPSALVVVTLTVMPLVLYGALVVRTWC